MGEVPTNTAIRTCITCDTRFISNKPHHVECRPCWAVALLLAVAARLTGVGESKTNEWNQRLVRLARALIGEARRSGTFKWEDE